MEEIEFEMWAEGYAVTGNSSGANYLGTAKGENFIDAVNTHVKANKCNWDFDPRGDQWAVWGCRIFDNEADARKSFG